MSSQILQPNPEATAASERRAWLRPVIVRLETGEAEAADGIGGDSNGWIS